MFTPVAEVVIVTCGATAVVRFEVAMPEPPDSENEIA